MRLQQIGAYNSLCSTQKNQQNKVHNTTSFGMIINATAGETKNFILKNIDNDGYNKFLTAVHNRNRYFSMLARFKRAAKKWIKLKNFSPSTAIKGYNDTELYPTFERKQNSLCCVLIDSRKNKNDFKNTKQKSDAIGLSYKKDCLEALTESLDNALDEYAFNRIFEL